MNKQEQVLGQSIEEVGKDFIENTMKFSFSSMDTRTTANRLLKCVEFGAKYQSERMYSEEDLEQAHFEGKLKKQTFKEWFKQFKKK